MKNARLFVQRGFTLVELMIAMLISLFLVGGLVTLVGAMKITFANQNGLSQLQESERMAMTLMSDVIESTGYFPLSSATLTNTANSSFPATAPFTIAGQAIFGTGTYGNQTAGGQTITVRYLTAGNDNVINCLGNTSAVAASFVNTFSIDALGNLSCTLILNGVAQPAVAMISGLYSIQIYYGVQTNTALSNNSVDAYLDANTVTNAAGGPYWSNVKSVQIKLTLKNPLAGQSGQATVGQYITFTRVIDVMNKNGAT